MLSYMKNVKLSIMNSPKGMTNIIVINTHFKEHVLVLNFLG